MIDTHAHLYLDDYNPDKCAAVDRALAAGVELMVLPAVDANSIQPILELHEARPEATAICAGLHPTELHDDWREHLERVESELRSERPYVAVGECGLDLYWEQDTLPQQLPVLEAQLQMADSLGLPAIIHCRNAMPQMLDLLEANKGKLPWMVFHCYSGNADDIDALRRLQPEVFFGIGGVVTFKKSELPELLPKMGLEHILLETDAPWLTPVPKRGKQNESAYMPYIADRVATEFQIPVEEVDRVTTESACKFFKLRGVRG